VTALNVFWLQCGLSDAMSSGSPSGGLAAMEGSAEPEDAQKVVKQIPYIRRVLVKALLRAIAMANYAQAATVSSCVICLLMLGCAVPACVPFWSRSCA
jgi:hypothetical protein